MNFKINDEVWFKDQDREEEGYYVCNIFLSQTNEIIYVAEDCNNCFVVGREEDFTLCDYKIANTNGVRR